MSSEPLAPRAKREEHADDLADLLDDAAGSTVN